jgi:GrpB-like predicted nucleotidyltransferase (UPF0157 family)
VTLGIPLEPELADRLRAAGVDPASPGDSGDAWRRLHARFGPRATLLDRYALEAAALGIPVHKLDRDLKSRIAIEVEAIQWPGFEFVEGSDRPDDDPVDVVDYDPGWPARYEEWRGRLSEALGPTAVLIEHVGSTAVPGLAAKPVIDVQVSVPHIEDELAYVPPIKGLGVALRTRDSVHRFFRPASGSPREVHIHVCDAGSEWERQHLLFRDFLRADDATRDAYAALKRDLADRYHDDRITYTDAKSNFILDVMERAEAWAASG